MIDPEDILYQGELFPIIENEVVTISGELKGIDMLFLHCDKVNNWGPTAYKICLETLVSVKNAAKSQGIDMIYTLIPGDDVKLLKFQLMFGFEIAEHYVDPDGKHYTLLSQET